MPLRDPPALLVGELEAPQACGARHEGATGPGAWRGSLSAGASAGKVSLFPGHQLLTTSPRFYFSYD